MAELKDGCVEPARGPITPAPESSAPTGEATRSEGVRGMSARVGVEAPDFEASAFIAGEGFKPIKLSDYKGQWIALCFYPGDFTFV